MTDHAVTKSPYHRVFVREVNGFSATVAELPGCIAQGDSLEECNANLERCMESWVEAALEQKYPVPPPSTESNPLLVSTRVLRGWNR